MTALTNIDEELLGLAKIGDAHGIRNALRMGANINAADDDEGETALMIAARHGHDHVVALLCETPGTRINQCDNTGQTALHHAALYDGKPETPSLEIATILLDAGADETIEDGFHYTPLMLAAQLKSYDLAVHLVQRGCNPIRTNIRMETALALCPDRNIRDTMHAIGKSLPQSASRKERETAWLVGDLAKNRKNIIRYMRKGPSL